MNMTLEESDEVLYGFGNRTHGAFTGVQMKVENANNLMTVMQALKGTASASTGTQQSAGGGASSSYRGGGVVCTVCLSSDGMHIQWDDETKSLQSQILVRKDSFADIYVHHSVEAPGRLTFGVPLNHLADTFSLFSSLGVEGLVLRYPNEDNQLELETSLVNSFGVEISTIAKLATVEAPHMEDWLDSWQGPDTSFHVPSSILREAVEDLEWTGQPVTLSITREPPTVELISSSNTSGTLSCKLPESEVSGLQMEVDHLRQSYNHKRLKRTLTNAYHHNTSQQQQEDQAHQILTKVSVSAEGTLKVMHMINASKRMDQMRAGVTLYGNTNYFDSVSQGGLGGGLGVTRTGIVQYILVSNAAL